MNIVEKIIREHDTTCEFGLVLKDSTNSEMYKGAKQFSHDTAGRKMGRAT